MHDDNLITLLKSKGLERREYDILRSLARHSNQTSAALRTSLNMPAASFRRVLAELIKKNLVASYRKASDRRQHQLRLTATGTALERDVQDFATNASDDLN